MTIKDWLPTWDGFFEYAIYGVSFFLGYVGRSLPCTPKPTIPY